MNLMLSFNHSSSGKPTTLGGRLGMTFFFSLFLIAGLVFTAALIWSAVSDVKTRSWTATPCTITSASINDSRPGEAFELSVNYSYEFPASPGSGTRTWTSNGISRNQKVYQEDDYRKIRRLADRYIPGAAATCYVDPADPARAILERGSWWTFAAIPFPLIFVAVGGGMIYWVWRPDRPKSGNADSVAQPRWVAPVVCLVFLVGGLGFLSFFIGPTLRMYAARDWQPTAATVRWSAVKSSHGEHGDTYAVRVFYEYAINGQPYRSSRYEFMGGSSSGYEDKCAIVTQMSAGSNITCYVNPADPWDAVIKRDASWVMLFAILPLLFILIGGGGLIGILFQRRKLHRDAASDAFKEFISRDKGRPPSAKWDPTLKPGRGSTSRGKK